MSKRELKRRIEELEARIVALEARPYITYPVYPTPSPWPPYPITYGDSTSDPLPPPNRIWCGG